ncbi:hypothetical protein T4B_3161 [Trichinella pseudospiralis]|uniref:Uncharacterized protein n=1 Tax=Trichinella pseudospiralis TaxID=6337 RepID=A0A0V1HDB6_TRIPS|nr:hypothetical protein T4B_3161 [Trichinella pseudospiralis]
MGRLPHGSSSTVSINIVTCTSRIRKSCFCYLTDFSAFFSIISGHGNHAVDHKYPENVVQMGVSFLAYSNLHFELKHYAVQLARYSDEEHYGTPSQIAHPTKRYDNRSFMHYDAINRTKKTTVDKINSMMCAK